MEGAKNATGLFKTVAATSGAKPVAPEKTSGGVVVQSGEHLQARRARLQARRADVDTPCILEPRLVAPPARLVAPP